MLPNFLIIGAPKAATTWIADGLREHPDIFVPQVKELRFFCGKNLDKGQEWYESQFDNAPEGSVAGEASPSYLGSQEAPERISQMLSDAKLIVTLRHPVEQVYSFYWHQLTRGEISLDTDFRSFFELQRPRASYYGSHLSRYLRSFGLGQLLILVYEEDIERNPRLGIRKCYEFLGVDPEFSPTVLEKKSNAKREISALHGGTRLVRQCLSVLPAEISRPLKRASKGIVQRLPKKKSQDLLDPELRRNLLSEYYIDDIRQLEQVSEKDFAVWYDS